jgi:hypothetical protein
VAQASGEDVTHAESSLVDDGSVLLESFGAGRRVAEDDGGDSAALASGAVLKNHLLDGSCDFGEEFLNAGWPGQSCPSWISNHVREQRGRERETLTAPALQRTEKLQPRSTPRLFESASSKSG